MRRLCSFAVVLLLSVFADAQTETVINNAGATVVEYITSNAAGVPVTQVLQTLVGTSTALTVNTVTTSTALTTSNPLARTTSSGLTTAATATTAQQAGPVGQPASEPATPGGPTPYTYTTTDANGNTLTLQGVFTPTGPQTVLPTPTTTGTVLGYSQWLSMIGTNTAPASAARRMSTPVATGWYYFAATTFVGLVGGAWLTVL